MFRIGQFKEQALMNDKPVNICFSREALMHTILESDLLLCTRRQKIMFSVHRDSSGKKLEVAFYAKKV